MQAKEPTTESTTLFTTKSEAYARYRAGYSEEAIDTILSGFDPEQTSLTDVGAGTGIASRLLADRGVKVTAVEPNRSMIRSAEAHPNVTFLQSAAETIPLEDQSTDIVTVFQAFHWFQFRKSLKEFHRILKPGGRLALAWNYWDPEDPFTRAYAELVGEATRKNSDRVEPYQGVYGKWKKLRIRMLWKFCYLPFFGNVRRQTFPLIEPMDLRGLIGCARSQSYLLHEGPVWDELVEKISELHSRERSPRLAYNVNVFTGEPHQVSGSRKLEKLSQK